MTWQSIQVRQASGAVRRVWPLLVVRGVLMAAFGLVTLLWPALTAVVLIAVFGAYAVLDGVITLGYGLRRRRSGLGGNGWLLQGGIAVAAGLVAAQVGQVVAEHRAGDRASEWPRSRRRASRGSCRSTGL